MKALEMRHALETICLKAGLAVLTIPLNGTRETREDVEAYWQQWTTKNNLAYQCKGALITIRIQPQET